MGKYKFRLSDMIPNAWFYKLKYMSGHGGSKKGFNVRTTAATTTAATRHCKSPQLARNIQPNRASCYISSRPEAHKICHSPLYSNSSSSPRKSMKRSRRKCCNDSYKNLVTASVNSQCNCRVLKAAEDVTEFNSTTSPERDYFVDKELDSVRSWSSSSSCTVTTSATEIIIDLSSKSSVAKKLDDFDMVRQLPPIQTKPVKKEAEQPKFVDKKIDSCKTVSSVKLQRKSNAKRSSIDLHRLHIRPNSPRLVGRKAVQVHRARRSNVSEAVQIKTKAISGSFAVVKSSANPQRDFRDSMMEMIVQNNIRRSKDLEDLLACYLTLNSDEYHDVIIKVFKQIWLEISKNKP